MSTHKNDQAPQNANTWLSGFYLSIPVALLSWVGFSSGLDNVFWPTAAICILLSIPWNLIAGFLVGLPAFFLITHTGLDGNLWPHVVYFSSITLGAHFNGYLLFSR